MYKKIIKNTLIVTALLGTSSYSFASLEECYKTGLNNDYEAGKELCAPYAEKDYIATGMLALAYLHDENFNKAIDYSNWIVNNYDKKSRKNNDTETVGYAYGILGDLYYFGRKEIPADPKKGLEYYTKSADLGNAIAQSQLGSFYTTDANYGIPWYFPKSYYWYTLEKINGGKSYQSSYIYRNLDTAKKQGAYCISLGQELVAQAYQQGTGGLAQSDKQAIEWADKGATLTPELSVVNFETAKIYAKTGDNDKAFEYAKKAVNEPYAPAYEYLGELYLNKGDKDKAKENLEKAISIYKDQNVKYWNKYEESCRPRFADTPSGMGLDHTEKLLGSL